MVEGTGLLNRRGAFSPHRGFESHPALGLFSLAVFFVAIHRRSICFGFLGTASFLPVPLGTFWFGEEQRIVSGVPLVLREFTEGRNFHPRPPKGLCPLPKKGGVGEHLLWDEDGKEGNGA